MCWILCCGCCTCLGYYTYKGLTKLSQILYDPCPTLFEFIEVTSKIIDFITTIFITLEFIKYGVSDGFVCCSNQLISECQPNNLGGSNNLNVTNDGFCYKINEELSCNYDWNNINGLTCNIDTQIQYINELCNDNERDNILRSVIRGFIISLFIKLIIVSIMIINLIIIAIYKYICKYSESELNEHIFYKRFTLDKYKKTFCCLNTLFYLFGPILISIIVILLSINNNVLSIGCQQNSSYDECRKFQQLCINKYGYPSYNDTSSNCIDFNYNGTTVDNYQRTCYMDLYVLVLPRNISFQINIVLNIISTILSLILFLATVRQLNLKFEEYMSKSSDNNDNTESLIVDPNGINNK